MNGKRKPLVAGNWKLQNTIRESVALAKAVKSGLATAVDCDVAVAPVFTALSAVGQALEGSVIKVSGQDVYWEEQGAFTGEVSAPLLKDVGCTYCIVGHSERRQFFHETDETVNRKTKTLLAHEIVPIVCIGERLEQREAGKTLDVVLHQLNSGLAGLDAGQAESIVIAYEPVWAIGTGRTASPADAQEVHRAIRDRLAKLYSDRLAQTVRILYGGSVKPTNAGELIAQPDIDGALVGGASLSSDSFVSIVRAATE